MKLILKEISEEIITERVLMRPYKKGDGKSFFNIIKENSDHFAKVVPEVDEIKSTKEAEIRNIKLMANWLTRTRFVLPIFLLKTMEMIGEIWIEPIDSHLSQLELGYLVVKKYEGKGIVSECLQAILPFIFNELQAEKIEIRTDKSNNKSKNVAIRNGFKEEGCIRSRYDKSQGVFQDRMFYGLLKNEYRDTSNK